MECFMEGSHNMHLNKARMGKSLSLECVESCSVDLQGAGRRRWRQRTRRAHDYDGCREAREIYGITQSHHNCYALEKREGSRASGYALCSEQEDRAWKCC